MKPPQGLTPIEAMCQSSKAMRILLVDDDPDLRAFITLRLREENYAVDTAADGDEARFLAVDHDYDLMILDLGLPKLSGMDVLQRVRQVKPDLPVLVLTGKAAVGDRVKGLDMGADDYLPKPSSWSELSARLRALLRRRSRPAQSTLRVEDLELNRMERTVTRGGRRIELTQKEFALLEFLMRNPGRPLTRGMILDNVWGLGFNPTTNVVDVYVNYLRRKVDDGAQPKLIETVRNVGYRIRGGGNSVADGAASPPPGKGPSANRPVRPNALLQARKI